MGQICAFFKNLFSFFCVLRAITARRAHCAPPPRQIGLTRVLKNQMLNICFRPFLLNKSRIYCDSLRLFIFLSGVKTMQFCTKYL